MGFEKFIKQRRPAKDKTMITLLKNGQLGVNRACFEKYFNGFKYAVLFFDAKERKIGIQPTNNETNEAFNIRLIKGGTLANIAIKSFLSHFEIAHEQSIAYPATWNDEDKLVEITIS